MAIQRFKIDGYGQLELNNVVFPRDGHIEAQCKLDDTDFATVPAEVGMLLDVDRANRTVKFHKAGSKLPVALHYSTEHMYDERKPGLKNFALERGSFLPRMGYMSVGEVFTTNCIAYDTTDYTNDETLVSALEKCATTAVYGGVCENGAIKLAKAAPTEGPVLKVVKYTDMPDGQPAVRVQVIA